MLGLDSILVHVREFGRYKKLLDTFQSPFRIFITFAILGLLFMQYFSPQFFWDDHFNCSDLTHLAPGEKKNLSFPYIQGRVDACFLTDSNISCFQELNKGQKMAENDFCKESFNRNSHQPHSSCGHVYNGEFWFSLLLEQAHTHPELSLLILAAIALIIGGVLLLSLSETLVEELPNVLEEDEICGMHQILMYSCQFCQSGNFVSQSVKSGVSMDPSTSEQRQDIIKAFDNSLETPCEYVDSSEMRPLESGIYQFGYCLLHFQFDGYIQPNLE